MIIKKLKSIIFKILWVTAFIILALIFTFIALEMMTLEASEFAKQYSGTLYGLLILIYVWSFTVLILAFAGKNAKGMSKFKIVDYFLLGLWLIAFVSFLLLVKYILEPTTVSFITDKNLSTLSAFFILLSASIASASVMKSIEANRELKDRDIENEDIAKRNYILAICEQIKKNHESMLEFTDDLETDIFGRKFIEDQFHSSLDLAKSILNDKYMEIIQQNDNNGFMPMLNDLNLFHKISTNKEMLKDEGRSYEIQNILKKIENNTQCMDIIINNISIKTINQKKC